MRRTIGFRSGEASSSAWYRRPDVSLTSGSSRADTLPSLAAMSMALLVIEAIFSWVNPHAPLAPLVRALNDPLLRPLRRVVPLLGGLDLSLLVALILLQIAQLLLRMAFGF